MRYTKQNETLKFQKSHPGRSWTRGAFTLIVALWVANLFVAGAQAEDGITADTILIGQSAALSGPAESLGRELKSGAEAYFNKVNASGGIHGRKIKLVSYDDQYEPDLCMTNTRKLIRDDGVFALFGYVGTPTTKAVMSIIDGAGVSMIGPFTGAGFLRDSAHKVFNIRASYDQETAAIVKELKNNLGIRRIACFYQDDAYGQVGLAGVEKAVQKEGMELLGSASYERNTTAIEGAAVIIAELEPEAVIMIGTSAPCAKFLKVARELDIRAKFVNISFVGTANLVTAVGSAGDGTYITQVVPSPRARDLALVREAVAILGEGMTYGELEGYLDAKVLVEGLVRSGTEPTRAGFFKAMESMVDFDAGGVLISYGSKDHQGSDEIYFTKISGGQAVPVANIE